MELFAKAVKQGLTFVTERGLISPQAVWQLPLTGNNGFNLDSLSRDVLKKVRASEEESLVVETKVSSVDELRLEILKFIIADKHKDAEAAKDAINKKARREELLALRAEKQKEASKGMSIEDIDKELSDLS